MITKLRIKNCLSFKDFTIRFNKLNVLVGENASGKSNLCHVLQFLKLSPTVEDLSEAFIRAAGVNASFNHFDIDPEKNNSHFHIECVIPREGKKLSFIYDLEIKKGSDRLIGTELSVVREKLTLRKSPERVEMVLFDNEAGNARILREKSSSSNGRNSAIKEKISINRTMLAEIIDSEEYISANLFKRFLSTIFHFDPMIEHLKDMTIYPSVFLIESRGKNLFYSINLIKNNGIQENNRNSKSSVMAKTESDEAFTNELWAEYLERIRLLDENIYDIDMNEEALRQNITIPVFTNKKGNKYGVDSLSSGTLRAMGILLAAIRAEKLKTAIGVTPIVSIEEPENGIHVGLLRMIYDSFKKSTGQYILTTHSPYLIDLFEDNLDGVKCFKKVNNETKLIKLDKKRIKTILEEMPLGEMHFRRILGRQ